MQQPNVTGNLTGAMIAPDRTEEMIEGTVEFPPSSHDGGNELASVRIAYGKEAEPVGSMPPPAGVKAAAKTALKAAAGKQPVLLLDRLGQRIAFERSGVRLYEALLSKFDVHGSFPGGPDREEIEHIRDEEQKHFDRLGLVVTELGGDPTAMTPSADVQATASEGITKVLVDPRTNLVDALQAILVAELADNDSWEALVALARGGGNEELAVRFEEMLANERDHLMKVRGWLAAAEGRPANAA